ncbi:MAG: glycosyltransferase family 4 protein [Pyrinomonadaceae bacterium]|nr:glycosyltransferase family 4 protein [Pyrinomonadaceae bacterium]
MADSSHSQSWIEMFANSNIDARVFANIVFDGGRYNPIKWNGESYVLFQPQVDRGVKVNYLIPNWKYTRFVGQQLDYRLSLNKKFLSRVINKWKPDIVHSLSLLPSGLFAWQAMKNIEVKQRPLFVCSSYGSDIYVSKDKIDERKQLEEILLNCDGFISDCERDLGNAVSIGLEQKKIAFDYGIPVTGGINVDSNHNNNGEKRNVILIPKAYEGFANKTLPILEALNLIKESLANFEIHLLMSDFDVEWYLSKMPQELKDICYLHKQIPKEQVLDLMLRSRAVVAPSISDGTPTSLLEAMWAGALPVVSPLESIKEWIVDKKNGLLVNAISPNEIADGIRRAISDDELFSSAQNINREVISKRANREIIRAEVINYYQTVMNERN